MIAISKDKPVNEAVTNVTLAVLEYVLEVGIDGALKSVEDVSERNLSVFPHVREALEKRKKLNNKS